MFKSEFLAFGFTFIGGIIFVGTFIQIWENGSKKTERKDFIYGLGIGGLLLLLGFIFS